MLVLSDYLELSESSTYRIGLPDVYILISERFGVFVTFSVGGYEGDIFFPRDLHAGNEIWKRAHMSLDDRKCEET